MPRQAPKKPSAAPLRPAAPAQVLDQLAVVRLRPAMYLGGTGRRGLHHMIEGIVLNGVEEHTGGVASRVSLALRADGGVCVEDDGAGIPVDLLEKERTSYLELLVTTLAQSATVWAFQPHKALGKNPHCDALPIANALSERFFVETVREGELFQLEYRQGQVTRGLTRLGPTDRRGTRITFWPDSAIFPSRQLDGSLLAERLRELSCLLPGLTMVLQDERPAKIRSTSGLVALLDKLRATRKPLHKALSVTETVGTIEVSLALQWVAGSDCDLISYANLQRTHHGGSHAEGLIDALHQHLRAPAGRKEYEEFPGLFAAVSVMMHNAQFAGPTRESLNAPEAREAVHAVASRLLTRVFAKSPKWREKITP